MSIQGIIGRKVGMTQVYLADGKAVPVTVIEAGPCVVVQRKTAGKDGYDAAQIGLVEARKVRGVTKPMAGHFAKAGVPPCRVLREVPVTAGSEAKVGDRIAVDAFAEGEKVVIVGISKGKGFQGVVKRHHFRGGAATHGSMFHRAPGSIGQSAFPSRVLKGMRAAGHMGSDRVTVKNVHVVRVEAEKNVLLIRGAVPGANGDLIVIRKAAKMVREMSDKRKAAAAPATLPVVNAENQKIRDVSLSPEVFGGRVNEHLLWEAVKQYRAGGRAGTHMTKNRALVSGSGKKPWRQKGTGRARVGGTRNPLWRHGGTVFGPQPRDYSYSVPKKARVSALRSALVQRASEGALRVVDLIRIEAPEAGAPPRLTRQLKAMLEKLGVAGKVTLVDSRPSDLLVLAGRNLPGVRVVDASHLTVYDALDCRTLLVSAPALVRLEERLAP